MSHEQQIRLDITSPIKKQRHLPALQPSSSSLACATSHKYSDEANTQAEANAAKRRQSRTRNTVLAMVIVTELIVQILSAAMVPFFPDHAKRYLNADSTIVGVIFSLYPLSLFLTSLVIGMASARFGRAFVYTSGLILLGGGTVGFGFCNDLTSIMIMRVVQGIGGGCINVAGMALLLQVSINIERDVGLDQAAIGLGYIVSHFWLVLVIMIQWERFQLFFYCFETRFSCFSWLRSTVCLCSLSSFGLDLTRSHLLPFKTAGSSPRRHPLRLHGLP